MPGTSDQRPHPTDDLGVVHDEVSLTEKLQRTGLVVVPEHAQDGGRGWVLALMNVLSAFVRERPLPPGKACSDTFPTADVQAAMTVLAHPHPEWDRGNRDLYGACLAYGNLTGARLSGTELFGARGLPPGVAPPR
jgi:hypothetical protein